MDKKLQNAIEVLNNGGIIIFPTDTAFGIGCRIDKKDAIKRLVEIRKRPQGMAMPVLVNGIEMAKKYSLDVTDDIVKNLIEPYWPGALTVVVKCKMDLIPELVRGGKDTVGLRMPNHKDILDIISNINAPILGTSANFHGERTPFTVKDLDPKLVSLVDYVLDGVCNLDQESTVIDVTVKPWKILRQGAIDITIS